MKRLYLILSIISLIFLQSCTIKEYFFDVDSTDSISMVSVKPLMQLNGDALMSLPINGTYTEMGVSASEVKLGDSDLDYEIVAGNVDPSKAGFYSVEYKAINSYGWSSLAYRAVLVYDGDPNTYDDITGTYAYGNPNTTGALMEIEKNDVLGYWTVGNCLNSTVLPLIFADLGDGVHYAAVPAETSIGRVINGTGIIQNGLFNFYITYIDQNGELLDLEGGPWMPYNL